MLTSNLAVYAEGTLPGSMKQMLKHSPAVPSIAHIVFSTFLMVIIIYIMAIAYHKLSAFNIKKFSCVDDKLLNLNKFKLISSMSLGANKTLHVVEINNKFLVVGSTPTSVTLLKEFDKTSLISPDVISATEFIIEEPSEKETTDEEPWMPELAASKNGSPNASAELDFEKIYKKYI